MTARQLRRRVFIGAAGRAAALALLGLGRTGVSRAAVQAASVPAAGTVGGLPEGVVFSGSVHLRSTLVHDPDFGKPLTVRLAIDLVDLTGRGLSSGARYVTAAEFVQRIEIDANEPIELTFPFQPQSRRGYMAARSAGLVLTLKFDARNGAIVGASCRVHEIE